jgi:tRNA pseudouridine55 synthase
MYSALKKDGQPLYKLARQGIEVERATRTVTIHELKILECTSDSATLEVQCSKGTYIRTLVEDLGTALGVGAYVSMLRRTEVSPFTQQPMRTLESFKHLATADYAVLDALLLPLDTALMHFPELSINSAQAQQIRQGQKVVLDTIATDAIYRLYRQTDFNKEFIGLAELKQGVLKAKRLLAY